MKKRDEAIDIASGIVILLVILGHLVPFDGYIFKIIFSFHMPYFFLKSGYYFKSRKFDVFMGHQIKRLLIPSLLMNCATLAVGIVTVNSFKDAVYFIFVSPTHEWFVMVLFFVQIIAYIYIYILHFWKDKKLEKYCLIFGIIILPSAASYALEKGIHDSPYIPFKVGSLLIALMFFLIGYYVKNFLGDVLRKKWILNKKMKLAYLFLVIIICVFTCNNTYVNVANCYWGRSDLYFVFTSIFWSLSTIYLARFLFAKSQKISSFLSLCGRNSLILYFGQSLLFSVFGKIIFYYKGIQYTPMIDLPAGWCVVYFIATLFILIPICIAKEKLRKEK